MHVERTLFWHSVLHEILGVLFFRKLTDIYIYIYIALWQSVNQTMSKKSLPHVIPPYRCDETDVVCLRRIEKQDMHASSHTVRPRV